MNALAAACMLVIAAGIAVGAAHAEPDPQEFLERAQRIQEELRPQIADAPAEARALFTEGEQKVAALARAIEDGDREAARENYKEAMRIFGEISGREWRGHDGARDPSLLLERIRGLAAEARERHPGADLAAIDSLLAEASRQIAAGDEAAALESLREAKGMLGAPHGKDRHAKGDGRPSDPRIFLKIAERLRDEIRPQIADAPAEARALFAEGEQRVADMARAIEDGDEQAAQESFKEAMRAFNKIIGREREDRGPRGGADLSGMLARMQSYAGSLKAAAERHGVEADFAAIDSLLAEASRQIAAGDEAAALESLREAKGAIKSVHAELRGDTSERGPRRSLEYAAMYVERLGAQIDRAAERGAPAGVVEGLRADLEAAKGTLARIEARAADGGDPGELLRELAGQLRAIKAALRP